MPENVKLSEAIAAWIAGRGVRHIFGIIGAGNIAIWDAVSALGKTEIVCCHHEQAAAMAASYYGRATGGLGICLVTTGAGSSNAITGVIAAHMDGTPLLVISGNEASKYMYADARIWGVQGYDSAQVAESFTKHADRIRYASDAIEILDAASDLALDRPTGAVWIDIPKDLQNEHP